jgi:tetratricopeptide (TPR) repeat protein
VALFRRIVDRIAGTRTGGAEAHASQSTPAAPLIARGNEALAQGRIEDAERCYREAVAADGGDALARFNLGYVLIQREQIPLARDALQRAIELARPGDAFLADAHYFLGVAKQQGGEAEGAVACYVAAVDERPRFAEAIEAAARLLLALGRPQEAVRWARRWAALGLGAGASLLLAQALHGMNRPAEALAALDEVLAVEPNHSMALEGRGHMLTQLGDSEGALAAFERVIALGAGSANTYANAAAALQRLGRFAQALARADEALARDPRHRNALYNRGAIALEMLRCGDALETSQRALALYPDDADIRWNAALAHLLQGDLPAGFAQYEARWQAAAAGTSGSRPDAGRPYWTGRESLRGKSILLFAEQGLGDSIQFLRYVPRVAESAERVVLRLPAALAGLARGIGEKVQIVAEGEELPRFDYACALLSLPLAFATTLESIPREVPYLHADAARVAAWRGRLEDPGQGQRIGVVWSGNPSHRNDRNRSIALATFRRIAVPGCTFVSLQPDVRPGDRAALDEWNGLLAWGGELRDFADTAALVSALDLVITVDTSVAHLAGALGRPVWILLPHCPDWRWMLDREDSPWYPTAWLVRQPSPGDWESVLRRCRARIAEEATTR